MPGFFKHWMTFFPTIAVLCGIIPLLPFPWFLQSMERISFLLSWNCSWWILFSYFAFLFLVVVVLVVVDASVTQFCLEKLWLKSKKSMKVIYCPDSSCWRIRSVHPNEPWDWKTPKTGTPQLKIHAECLSVLTTLFLFVSVHFFHLISSYDSCDCTCICCCCFHCSWRGRGRGRGRISEHHSYASCLCAVCILWYSFFWVFVGFCECLLFVFSALCFESLFFSVKKAKEVDEDDVGEGDAYEEEGVTKREPPGHDARERTQLLVHQREQWQELTKWEPCMGLPRNNNEHTARKHTRIHEMKSKC